MKLQVKRIKSFKSSDLIEIKSENFFFIFKGGSTSVKYIRPIKSKFGTMFIRDSQSNAILVIKDDEMNITSGDESLNLKTSLKGKSEEVMSFLLEELRKYSDIIDTISF